MIFGLSTFSCYMYLSVAFEGLNLTEAKNWLLIMPLLFILSALEIFAELKWGAKNAVKFIFKGIKKSVIWCRIKHIKHKIKKQAQLTKRQLKFFQKHNKQGDSKC